MNGLILLDELRDMDNRTKILLTFAYSSTVNAVGAILFLGCLHKKTVGADEILTAFEPAASTKPLD